MRKLKNQKGITLVALVTTIIILIILAGISINIVLGDNGIISKAREAKESFERAANEEQAKLDDLYAEMNKRESNKGKSKDIIYADDYFILRDNGVLSKYMPYFVDGEMSTVDAEELNEDVVATNVKEFTMDRYIITNDGKVYKYDYNDIIDQGLTNIDRKVEHTFGYYYGDTYVSKNNELILKKGSIVRNIASNVAEYSWAGENGLIYRLENKELYVYNVNEDKSFKLIDEPEYIFYKKYKNTKLHITDECYYLTKDNTFCYSKDENIKIENVEYICSYYGNTFVLADGKVYACGDRSSEIGAKNQIEGEIVCLSDLEDWSIYNKKIKKINLSVEDAGLQMFAITDDGEVHFWGRISTKGNAIPGYLR